MSRILHLVVTELLKAEKFLVVGNESPVAVNNRRDHGEYPRITQSLHRHFGTDSVDVADGNSYSWSFLWSGGRCHRFLFVTRFSKNFNLFLVDCHLSKMKDSG